MQFILSMRFKNERNYFIYSEVKHTIFQEMYLF